MRITPRHPSQRAARRRVHASRGQSLVEGTLVMLLFFGMLFGAIDFGQVIFAHQSLVERVRAAARWGSLHTDNGADPVRNMVLYGHPEPGATEDTFLRLAPENVVVEYDGISPDGTPQPAAGGVPTLHVEIVNFEAPLFSPWWPGLAHRFMNPRPVSVTAPVSASTPAASPEPEVTPLAAN